MKYPSDNWAAGKPAKKIRLSEKVKSIILARAAQLREQKVETLEDEGGQADE